jgi:hypothetical protein
LPLKSRRSVRAQQRGMALAVAEAIRDNAMLVAEAGICKTFATIDISG